ncbi:MAG: Stk1 family PASTA domain-containing Ser/Thr kinase [Clostridia bacterium]|nr:Stk1 family PASTA domain-containing Ser/Thr kinase [Clostridia bacterium]
MMNGTLIGNRYEIVETIGKGGMAIVYKAKCQVLNRYVALKVLRPEFREDKEFLNRFKAEAQSAGSLSHPNIVSIFDVCQENDLDYIVMEYVEGVTLKQYVDAKGTIPWREAVDYAAQICAGLDHAHKKGIIHKDIKPHNILITREGTLKITDFGIAKVMSSSTITTGNATMGSVHYFSPEQARGGFLDYKTDIYSLGVVLYEMVTGKLPFEGDTAIAIAMQHIEKAPASPCTLNPEVPKALEQVIGRAMCKEQNLRYDSVMQMMVDLKKVYTGNTVDYSNLASGATTVTPIIRKGAQPVGRQKTATAVATKKAPAKKRKDVWSIIGGIAAGLALVGILFAVGYFITAGNKPETTQTSVEYEVPNLTNKTVQEAEVLVAGGQLKIIVEKEENSETVAAGKIISQSPAEGRMLKEGSEIRVVVSLGAGEFLMPNLLNSTKADVEELLKSKNLQYAIVEEFSNTIAKDCVTRQTPVAGTYIDTATSVTLYVSKGPREVPNLIGLTVEQAKQKLLPVNMTIGKTVEASSTKQKGIIIGQSIPAGVRVAEQTSIDVRVSSGSGSSQTPTPSSSPTPGIVIGPPNAGGN